mgnify:CR=1 FL=1
MAARKPERAKEFADKFDIQKVCGSYKELAECSDIGIVNYFQIIKVSFNSINSIVCGFYGE